MNYSLITNSTAFKSNSPNPPAIEVIDRYGVNEWVVIPRNPRVWRPSNVQQLKEFVAFPTDVDTKKLSS